MTATTTLNPLELKSPAPDMTQTDLYRAMRAEAAKLDSASAQVDWSDVMALSRRVLEELGQDLLAAAYWAHARHMCEGAEVLPASLDTISQLLEEAWSQMSPPLARIKGRAGALDWLVQHTTHALQLAPPNADALDTAALTRAVRRLQTAAQSRLEERAPGFSKLRGVMERRVAQHKPIAPVTRPEPAAAPLAPPAPVAAPQAPSEPATGPIAGMRLSTLGEMVCAHALELRRTEPQSATAMRLMRSGLWLHIDKAPPHVSGVTRIAPLPAAVRATLQAHKTQKCWQAVVDEVEKRILQYRMHLDLQRDAALALRQLGAPFAGHLLVVEQEVRAFVSRVPELATLQAADKTPLADEETQAWLRTLTRSRPAPVVPKLSVAPVALQDDVSAGHDGVRRFQQRLAAGEDALQQGHSAVALAIFRGLYRQLTKKQLIYWDNALSMRALLGFWRCLQSRPEEAALMRNVFERIARLDAKIAIEIS